MGIIKCKKCRGMVIESDKVLSKSSKMTEFTCIMCGNTFEFSTAKYIKVLDAIGVDYQRRLVG